MFCTKLKLWFQEEQKKLSTLSWKQKLEYIWTYYKWWLLMFVLLVYIIVSGVQNAQYQSKQVLVSGIFINTATSEEGYAYLKDGYREYAGGDEDTRVELIEARSIRFNAEQPTSIDLNAILNIDAYIASRELDYIIGDQTAVEFYDQQGALLDLGTLLSEDQLSRWNPIQSENGTVAIDLTGSSFEKQFELSSQPSYLMVLVNTPRAENCSDFLKYLLLPE
ncbi:MAG: hypothetical protein ACI4PO_06455 [Faecousia sp.]